MGARGGGSEGNGKSVKGDVNGGRLFLFVDFFTSLLFLFLSSSLTSFDFLLPSKHEQNLVSTYNHHNIVKHPIIILLPIIILYDHPIMCYFIHHLIMLSYIIITLLYLSYKHSIEHHVIIFALHPHTAYYIFASAYHSILRSRSFMGICKQFFLDQRGKGCALNPSKTLVQKFPLLLIFSSTIFFSPPVLISFHSPFIYNALSVYPH